MVFPLAGALFFPGQAQAQAPSPRTVSLVDTVTLPKKVPRAHERMRAKLESVLTGKGWTLAVAIPPAGCEPATECLPKVAKQTGSKHVLLLSGEGNSENGYNVTLRLFSTAENQMRTNAAYCDLCNVDSLAEIIKRMGMEMLNSAEEAASKAQQSQPALPLPAPLSAPPPEPPKTAANLVSPPVTSRSGSVSWLPWTLAGTGAAVALYGAWVLHKEGEGSGSCSPTHDPTTCDHYSARGLGLGTTIGGGLVFVAGTMWGLATLTRSTSVSASPNHVSFNVRF